MGTKNRKNEKVDLSAVQQLVRIVAKSTGLTFKGAREAIDLVFEGVTVRTLATGRFSWPKFGTWLTSVRAARNVINPQTHEVMRLQETKGVRFRPSRFLLEKARNARGVR